MDIAALSVALSQNQLATDVGASLLNVVKDSMGQQGDALQQLMNSTGVSTSALELSVNPNVGGNIDIKL